MGVELLLADAANVSDVPMLPAGPLAGAGVVGLVQTQVLKNPPGVGTLDHGRVKRWRKQLAVVAIGTVEFDAKRTAPALYVEALLGSRFGSISRIGPLFTPPILALPIIPSTACHSQSRSPSASHSRASVAQISSSTPSSTKR